MLDQCKKEIAKYSNLLYDRGLVGAAGGNVSMRYKDAYLITASGVSLRDVTVDDILLVDRNCKVLGGREGIRPSKETILHIKIYMAREDADSIIHIHPVYTTGFSVKNISVPIITASAKLKLIKVPLVKYADPGSSELAENVEACVKNSPAYVKAIVLEKHGLIAFDKGIGNCFDIAELVEETAKIAFVSLNI
ncbi:MAG: class II aldolase/adducin family protein [Ruminiclostridium sp.]|nr:class II aldolase/adducin family protein [Ruminiclostridium sp.]